MFVNRDEEGNLKEGFARPQYEGQEWVEDDSEELTFLQLSVLMQDKSRELTSKYNASLKGSIAYKEYYFDATPAAQGLLSTALGVAQSLELESYPVEAFTLERERVTLEVSPEDLKDLLRQQFNVYKESKARYEQLVQTLGTLTDPAQVSELNWESELVKTKSKANVTKSK